MKKLEIKWGFTGYKYSWDELMLSYSYRGMHNFFKNEDYDDVDYIYTTYIGNIMGSNEHMIIQDGDDFYQCPVGDWDLKSYKLFHGLRVQGLSAKEAADVVIL